ncbi:MAG: SDR family NAD(P)-dependent oxidoreductase [Pirellulaceae bacterium]
MIETAIAAAGLVQEREAVRLEHIRIQAPCMLAPERPMWIETRYDEERRQLKLAFREIEHSHWTPLATFDVSSRPQHADPTISNLTPQQFSQRLESIRAKCTEGFDRSRLYAYCRALGLQYETRFQGVLSGLVRPGEALVEVSLLDHSDSASNAQGYHLHPALLDSCFHAMIAADPNFDHTLDGLYLPAEIRDVTFHRPPSDRVIVHARMLSKTPKLMICDLDVFTPFGELCLTVRHFESRRVNAVATTSSQSDMLYNYQWQSQPLQEEAGHSIGNSSQNAAWLLFMDEGHVGQELAQRLRSRRHRVVAVYRDDSHVPQSGSESFYQVDPESRESFSSMLETVQARGFSVAGIVYLWGLDVPSTDRLNSELLDRSTILTTLAPLHFVQAWEAMYSGTAVNLSLVTSGAQSTDGEPESTNVAAAPLIGFGRVIASESSRLRAKLIDLPRKLSPCDMDNLLSELLAGDEEDEVQWRDGRRFVHRFLPSEDEPLSADAARLLPSQLQVGNAMGIEELRYESKSSEVLEPGQVEIEVLAAGLNFSDVMKALDLYPGLTDCPVELGAECSGRISRVSAKSHWQVGDEVIAIAPGSFATHVVVNEALVAPKPSRLSHAEAAAIPIAFLTAEYAINECARLQAGQSILIHSASGGVGLAAIQLAKIGGIRVFATAGSDAKRQFVKAAGATLVMDSRSLAFGDEVLRATAGKGVDAVLNSLPGEAIKTGLSILQTGGKFLEIGKRDIYNDAALGLYPFRNNLSLFAIDLDQLFKQQPQRMGTMLRQLVERFETGELRPLPTRSYSASETGAAFRFMQQSKHIGKVAVTYDVRPSKIFAGQFTPLVFDGDATYWIAGGLGGFGFEIARWMIDSGARTLVLSGRSQTLHPEAEQRIAELSRTGARIVVLPTDIAQPAKVRATLRTIDRDLPPLRGIFHTAMVLEDKLLGDLDRPTLERVLRPKVLGGWNLHQQTLGRDLHFFVLFSSLSSVFGHAGQANYSAANALLDSLAYHRRALGLPALVMNWGHLGEVGYLAEREELGKRLERQGVLSFTIQQATDCLQHALQSKAIQQSVLRIDWSVWRGLGITDRISPRFAHLIQQSTTDDSAAIGESLTAENLRTADSSRRAELVQTLLSNKLSSLLGISAKQIPVERTLLEMGLDSLMAVELRNWIESQLDMNIPIAALMRGGTSRDITNQLVDMLADTLADGTQNDLAAQEPATLLEELPNLEAERVSELLSQMLREPS